MEKGRIYVPLVLMLTTVGAATATLTALFSRCDLTHAWAPIGYVRSLVDGGSVQRLTNADRNYRKCPYEEENCIQVDPPYPMTSAGPVVRVVRSRMCGCRRERKGGCH